MKKYKIKYYAKLGNLEIKNEFCLDEENFLDPWLHIVSDLELNGNIFIEYEVNKYEETDE